MSWYSKAWDKTKSGYARTLDASHRRHWGWSAGIGSGVGAGIGAGVGYGYDGNEGAMWGAGIGALTGAGAGYGFKRYMAKPLTQAPAQLELF